MAHCPINTVALKHLLCVCVCVHAANYSVYIMCNFFQTVGCHVMLRNVTLCQRWETGDCGVSLWWHVRHQYVCSSIWICMHNIIMWVVTKYAQVHALYLLH